MLQMLWLSASKATSRLLQAGGIPRWVQQGCYIRPLYPRMICLLPGLLTLQGPGLQAAYVHLPFCKRKCFYCDFPVVATGSRTDSADVRDSMQAWLQEVTMLLMGLLMRTLPFPWSHVLAHAPCMPSCRSMWTS